MPTPSAARAYNALEAPKIDDPVAVFVGGTNGIGRAMASAFAQHNNGRARIVIIGRSQEAADSLRASLPSPAREQMVFIPCDMRLMRNVAAAVREIASHGITKINYLVMSSGVLPAEGRKETDEGIDEKLAIVYYGRWKFLYDLQPQLKAALAAGEPAKVISVQAAGGGAPIDVDDLGLKKKYGLIHTAQTHATYNDLMVVKFAELHPEMTFVHSYPGVVRTSILANAPSLALKALYYVLYPFMTLIGHSAEDCAELMWYALYHSGPGVERINPEGESIGMTNYFGDEESKERLWEHTLEATRSK
ncbi:hypothetical protein GGG16DRAFT_84682 [Schizophyllum commune]